MIDALYTVTSQQPSLDNPDLAPLLDRPMVLITAHRRESWGEPMACSARAIARLARAFPHMAFLLPAHLNPIVREVLLPPLAGLDNVVVTNPLSYSDFALAMAASTIVLTDSGGVQEEAPSLGKPVLVMRETTERPEAVTAGTVRLVGTDEELIVDWVTRLLTRPAAYERWPAQSIRTATGAPPSVRWRRSSTSSASDPAPRSSRPSRRSAPTDESGYRAVRKECRPKGIRPVGVRTPTGRTLVGAGFSWVQRHTPRVS